MAEDNNIEEQKVENAEEQTVENAAEATAADNAASEATEATTAETAETETATAEPVDERDARIAELEAQVAAQKDQYLRLYAEFDNYKKRTLKEKAELIQTAGKNVLEQMLPLIDDVERAMASVKTADSVDGVKEGVDLIYNKFVKFLDSNNVKEIETVGLPFNTDFHEAVAQVPMGEDKKGVVIDCTQKGYVMGEKVVRFAKVVIGA
ncbi:MAG: nucleotide exchange factor GrpE [Paludibacteraceae bacterium]|nr:nucleotide exchange factor GrpE [Paludibacteraceae bacterium]